MVDDNDNSQQIKDVVEKDQLLPSCTKKQKERKTRYVNRNKNQSEAAKKTFRSRGEDLTGRRKLALKIQEKSCQNSKEKEDQIIGSILKKETPLAIVRVEIPSIIVLKNAARAAEITKATTVTRLIHAPF